VGTVSEPCALALAKAVRQRLGATWALGICGNAGPGDEGGAPVGAIHLALAGPGDTVVRSFTIGGGRLDVQLRTAGVALDLLRRTMRNG
jgi:nicotinamide mononucleotide (NMN) deamidase PncC